MMFPIVIVGHVAILYLNNTDFLIKQYHTNLAFDFHQNPKL